MRMFSAVALIVVMSSSNSAVGLLSAMADESNFVPVPSEQNPEQSNSVIPSMEAGRKDDPKAEITQCASLRDRFSKDELLSEKEIEGLKKCESQPKSCLDSLTTMCSASMPIDVDRFGNTV